ncbi:PilN domain-containing protein [Gemmatimonadota bacterium]
MIEVNLLPGGKKRASRGAGFSLKIPSVDGIPKDPWILVAVAAVVIALSLGFYLNMRVSNRFDELTLSVAEEVADSADYFDLIQSNNALNARRDSIAQRVSIIQEIDGDRYVWPHILDEVARALPDYTWLTEIMQISGGPPLEFRITGRAGTDGGMTQFMENLQASLFIRVVDLIRSESVSLPTGTGTNRLVTEFEFEVSFEFPPMELLDHVPLFDAAAGGEVPPTVEGAPTSGNPAPESGQNAPSGGLR